VHYWFKRRSARGKETCIRDDDDDNYNNNNNDNMELLI
jgi:hypothetical protein